MIRRIALLALGFCALGAPGCVYLRPLRIDPSGERIFAEPPIGVRPVLQDEPAAQRPWDAVAVTLTPHVTVAPAGSEVVLVAGVSGADSGLEINCRLEWSMEPGGVGHFVAVGRNAAIDLWTGNFTRPRKVDSTFAIGSTSRRQVLLNRGTPTTSDDVCVYRGQGWISVTSQVEGTSHVTVFAPDVYPWDARTRSATIHWVDAQWHLPPPAIIRAGSSHPLTTTVTRHTDQTPCVGWLVRYEIVDGPPAGFAPEGAAAVEVPTDAAGQATVELFQKEPGPGTNQIAIQVIRPAALGGPNGKRLAVGRGATTTTWTAAALAVRKTAPAVASIGATVTYRIEVTNPGDLPAEEVVVTDTLCEALAFVSANPPPQTTGKQLRWNLGQLAARGTRSIELNCRASQQGSVTNCADATAAGGLKATGCATTTVMVPTVGVQVSGPAQATVGSDVTFTITIANGSQVPTENLLIKDRFEEGLGHAVAVSPIERDLGSLAAGESRQVKVTFRVTKPGRLCHSVEVSDPQGIRARAQGCVTGVAAPPGALPPRGFGGPVLPRAEGVTPPQRASLKVRKTGPQQLRVGEMAKFTIEITNDGEVPLTQLKVDDAYDAALFPKDASDGNQFENNHLVWKIDRLGVGKTLPLEIHCECLRASAETCNRVTVTSKEGAAAKSEACLAIRPPAGKLNMALADLVDPVRLGKELTYEVRVTNDSDVPDEQVVLVVTVPLGMMPVPIGTSGPKLIRYTIAGQLVRFDPVAQCAPGERLSYRVRVSTREAGELTLRAELTSRNRPEPLIVEETTEVFP